MRTVCLILVLFLPACTQDMSVWIYKSTLKKNLREICSNEQCVAAVDENFDSCVKDDEIKKMLVTVDVKKSEEKNNELVENLIVCINTQSGVEYFINK